MRQIMTNYRKLIEEERSYLLDVSNVRARTALRPSKEAPSRTTSPTQTGSPLQKDPVWWSRYEDPHYAGAIKTPEAQNLWNDEHEAAAQPDHLHPDNNTPLSDIQTQKH